MEAAFKNSPKIRAANLKWAKLLQRYPQAVAWDDPILSYTFPVSPIETRLGPQEHIFKVTQKFPFPGKLGLKGEIMVKDVEIAKTEYERTIRDLVVAVKKSFYEYSYIVKALDLARQNLKVLEHLNGVGTTDYTNNKLLLNDVLKAQSRYAQAAYDVILLEEMLETEKTRINTLINRDPETALGRPVEPIFTKFPHTLEEVYKMAGGNEELKSADFKIDKTRVMAKLAKLKRYPNFMFGFNYVSIGGPPTKVTGAGKDAYGAMVGLTIPLWTSKNKAVINEAELTIKEQRERKKVLKNEILNKVKKAFFKLNNSERLIKLYGETLLPQAKKSMELSETWYKNGEAAFASFLEAQSIWFNFQTAYFRAKTDYLKGIADLEKITGMMLVGLSNKGEENQ
ncbi:MAG: TolC family protein [Nitrospinota bacterium]